VGQNREDGDRGEGHLDHDGADRQEPEFALCFGVHGWPTFRVPGGSARLRDIAAGISAADPSLTRHQAFAKAYDANPDLAARAKREQEFA
jgi:hypothetical protein